VVGLDPFISVPRCSFKSVCYEGEYFVPVIVLQVKASTLTSLTFYFEALLGILT